MNENDKTKKSGVHWWDFMLLHDIPATALDVAQDVLSIRDILKEVVSASGLSFKGEDFPKGELEFFKAIEEKNLIIKDTFTHPDISGLSGLPDEQMETVYGVISKTVNCINACIEKTRLLACKCKAVGNGDELSVVISYS